jgi:nicotinamidase-related amidase
MLRVAKLMKEETDLEALDAVLLPRPERLRQVMFTRIPQEMRPRARAAAQTLSAMALAADPVALPAALRARLLARVAVRVPHVPRRALLVCDMINDHLAPGRPMEVPRARAIVAALGARLDAARAEGTPVVYVLDRHAADDPELDEWGVHALEGTEGAEVWPPLAPRPGDHIVTKPSMSAFFASGLDDLLDRLAVDTLVLTGCATEVQLMATAADALQRGFAVEVPRDAQAGSSDASEDVVLNTLSALAPYAPARKERLARNERQRSG